MPALPDLRRTQELFWTLITAPEGVRPALEDLRRQGALEAAGLDPIFAGDARLAAADRLDIYANMYFFRLHDCLREDYARVAAAIGSARFHNLITDYLLRHPSSHPSLRFLGERLPGFIAGHAILSEFPYLADLARLEWARADLFDAPDVTPIDREALARLPGDLAGEARLGLVPALALLRFDHEVVSIWRGLEEESGAAAGNSASREASHAPDGQSACSHDEPPRGPGSARRKKTAARVWRHGFGIYHRSVDQEEARCLDLAAAGETLGRVCQLLAAGRSPARATARVGRMIQAWIDDGILARLEIPS
ncbi:MAG TPA: DNA-binding domain-containing protein [Candidatus Polarisedimenticolia bacterium]|nr:DNA-binding domain-containing protein [Candidatus Polarisedimenticolia bacterium]